MNQLIQKDKDMFVAHMLNMKPYLPNDIIYYERKEINNMYSVAFNSKVYNRPALINNYMYEFIKLCDGVNRVKDIITKLMNIFKISFINSISVNDKLKCPEIDVVNCPKSA